MKAIKLCLLTSPVLLVLSGCLTSQEPFYEESDIVVDDRLVGSYRYENEQSGWQVEKDLDRTNRYRVTLLSDIKPCYMQFTGVLFQVGTNRFLDMLPMLEACDHVGGGPPSPIEILQSVTVQPMHLVMRIEPSTNGLRYGLLEKQGMGIVVKEAPSYFQAHKPEQFPRLVADTKRQRDFLMRFGSDTNIFKPFEITREIKASR